MERAPIPNGCRCLFKGNKCTKLIHLISKIINYPIAPKKLSNIHLLFSYKNPNRIFSFEEIHHRIHTELNCNKFICVCNISKHQIGHISNSTENEKKMKKKI